MLFRNDEKNYSGKNCRRNSGLLILKITQETNTIITICSISQMWVITMKMIMNCNLNKKLDAE